MEIKFKSPYATTSKGSCVSDQWFAGDVIPFENCAYIVNMQYFGGKQHYSFHRLTTATRWDKYKKKKLVVTQLDH